VTTAYSYSYAQGGLSKLVGPQNKTWSFNYNSAGQVTDYTHGNGLQTFYTYDAKRRLSTIAHKDGETVLESFDYDVDDTVNISKVTHADGSYWDYGYDGRYRLTSASRKSASGNIAANFAYTYDDADNLLTKVEPFAENFDDGNFTGWTVSTGTWSAASGMLTKTSSADGVLYKSLSADDAEHHVAYRCDDAANGGNLGLYGFRWGATDYARIHIYPGSMHLYQKKNGVGTTLDSNTAVTSDQGVW
jgi:YD repeat-containing protein